MSVNNIYGRENRRVLTSESSGWHASVVGAMKAPCLRRNSILGFSFFLIVGLGRERDGVSKSVKVTIQSVLFLIFSFVISKTIRDVLV